MHSSLAKFFVTSSILFSFSTAWAQEQPLPSNEPFSPTYQEPVPALTPAPQIDQPVPYQPLPNNAYPTYDRQPNGNQLFVASPAPAQPFVLRRPTRSYFHPRVGMELSLVANPIWNQQNSNAYFMGGIDAKFLFGLHPRIALEVTGALIGTGGLDFSGTSLIDGSLTAGLRIYLHRNPHIFLPSRVAPYLAGAVGGNFARLLDGSAFILDSSNYFMYLLGGGFEFRFAHERLAINIDLRFIGQNRLDSRTHWIDTYFGGEFFSQNRYGFRGTSGFSFFFN